MRLNCNLIFCVQILMRTFSIREKSHNNGRGISADTFIAQQPKAIES